MLLPRIKLNEEIPKKDFIVSVVKLEDPKGEAEESPPEMLYRQRRKNRSGKKRTRNFKKK